MKIGILLVGVSFGKGAYGSGKDFRQSVKNFKDTILHPLSEKNDVRIYICTYSHEHIEELKSEYNPEKIELLDYSNSNQISTYVHGLNMLKNEDLDFIVSTRFDIQFQQKITDLNVDYDKANFLYGLDVLEAPWKSWEFVTDNIFMFNKKYLDSMLNSIHELVKNPPREYVDLHGIYKKMKMFESEENLNIAIEEKGNYFNQGKYYKLIRS